MGYAQLKYRCFENSWAHFKYRNDLKSAKALTILNVPVISSSNK